MLVTPSMSEMFFGTSILGSTHQPRHLSPEENAKLEHYTFETIKTMFFFVIGFMMSFITQTLESFSASLSGLEMIMGHHHRTAQHHMNSMMPFFQLPGLQLTNVVQK